MTDVLRNHIPCASEICDAWRSVEPEDFSSDPGSFSSHVFRGVEQSRRLLVPLNGSRNKISRMERYKNPLPLPVSDRRDGKEAAQACEVDHCKWREQALP